MLAAQSAGLMLAEQVIPDEAAGAVVPAAFITGAAIAQMLDEISTDAAFDRLIATLVQDAGRTAMSVAGAVRPAVTGHVRYLNLPSCSRCVILAGRVYRYSDGFQRHPLCDCQMVLTTEEAGADLVSDPMEALERGLVRGLSQDDIAALELGADLGQVVNVRRKKAGLTTGSSVMSRGGRLTPAGIFRLASDRAEVIALLRRFGYITT